MFPLVKTFESFFHETVEYLQIFPLTDVRKRRLFPVIVSKKDHENPIGMLVREIVERLISFCMGKYGAPFICVLLIINDTPYQKLHI